MKSAPVWQDGYTIVEVMIFLVISAALLLSVTSIFTNQITNTQFNQSVRGLDAKIRTVANSAATGTIPADKPFNCNVVGGDPRITAVGNQAQGSRTDCIFVGKVMNFNRDAASEKTDTYTAIGRRIISANGNVSTSLIGTDGSNPRIITSPDVTDSYNIGSGTRVTGVYRQTSTGRVQVSAVGFFQSFNSKYQQGSLTSASQGVETWTVTKALSPVAPSSIANIDEAVNADLLTVANQGAVVCLKNGTRKGSITMGSGNAGTLTTTILIGDTQCP